MKDGEKEKTEREEVLEGLQAWRGRYSTANTADLDRAIAFLQESHPQEAAGMVLAFVDMARTLEPPPGLSGKAALVVFASFAEVVARDFFGAEVWDGVTGATKAAARQQGLPPRSAPPASREEPS